MKTIEIFLASSKELAKDRNDFEIFISRKNNELIPKGVHLRLNLWEDFIDAMSNTRLQEEYNNAVRQSDIFVMLFFTKVGLYTEEEFSSAFGQFKATSKPIIYTYFKDSQITTGSVNKKDMKSVWAFQKKLQSLGHYQTKYKNIAELKLHFNEQLEKLDFSQAASVQSINAPVRMDEIDQFVSANLPSSLKTATIQDKQNHEGNRRDVEPWQDKLVENLETQLQLPELNKLTELYIDKLLSDQRGLSSDINSVAKYLVFGQGDRQKQLAQFLTAVKSTQLSKSHSKQVEKLWGYLLQTLVVKCFEEGDQGWTLVSVQRKETMALIGHTRAGSPYLASESKQNLEHVNSEKCPEEADIGRYFPVTGDFDENNLCNSIARDLLPIFMVSEKDAGAINSENCFDTLIDCLKCI